MLPFIRSFQDNMTSWVNIWSINRMGAYRRMLDKLVKIEQLAQTVATSAPRMPSPDKDQVQYLRAQLPHRDAQLEHVRSERDTHFVQEKEPQAHMCLQSNSAAKLKTGSPERSAKRNKHYAKSPQKPLTEPQNYVQEAMDKQFQARWRQAALQDTRESSSAQVQQLAERLQRNELQHQQRHTAKERRLQLEAQACRRSQDLEQE